MSDQKALVSCRGRVHLSCPVPPSSSLPLCQRWVCFPRRNFDCVATAQPPATTKIVQYRHMLVNKKRQIAPLRHIGPHGNLFIIPHSMRSVLYLLCHSLRLCGCYKNKMAPREACPPLPPVCLPGWMEKTKWPWPSSVALGRRARRTDDVLASSSTFYVPRSVSPRIA